MNSCLCVWLQLGTFLYSECAFCSWSWGALLLLWQLGQVEARCYAQGDPLGLHVH